LELNNSEDKRAEAADDIDNLNKKIITLEEELYESKQIQLELLENLNLTNEKFDNYVNENESMVEQLEKEQKE